MHVISTEAAQLIVRRSGETPVIRRALTGYFSALQFLDSF
jgi:hypothetical protein